MKTETRKKLLDYIRSNGTVTPHALQLEFKLSGAAIHKQLRKLEADFSIQKIGKPPKVFYMAVDEINVLPAVHNLPDDIGRVIEENFLYVNPDGVLIEGVLGFIKWAEKTKQEAHIQSLAREYVATRQKADHWFHKEIWIDATEKLKMTFQDSAIDLVAYKDFYALPKFGKTRLGALTLHAKVSQSRLLMHQVADEITEAIQEIIVKNQIEAVAFVPHSVPRLVPFLTVIKQELRLQLPEIKLEKIYQGEIRVAQKSLSKIEERIENAQKTIVIVEQIPYKRVLLIDDAVGSGATFNEVAKKLKAQGTFYVAGFAVVGSYKGFEVIQEV